MTQTNLYLKHCGGSGEITFEMADQLRISLSRGQVPLEWAWICALPMAEQLLAQGAIEQLKRGDLIRVNLDGNELIPLQIVS